MIEARCVSVRAGHTPLVRSVDLDVGAGEVLGIVGPNGAGKSTLLAALAGDRALAAGEVRIAGRDVARASIPELARLRAVLPQRSLLSLPFTALEVVRLAGPAVPRALAHRCLGDVELANLADRAYPSLSGGEQQRVQLARVLAQLAGMPRAALLLDEPTSALDPKHQRLVLALARRAASVGHAVVVVLHDLTLAARTCDRIALLASGRLLAAGSPASVLAPELLASAYAVPFDVIATPSGLVVAAS